MKTKIIHLNPTKPPFTSTISFEGAVQFNLEDRLPGIRFRTMTRMFSTLLEELHENGVLTDDGVAKILDLEITKISEDEPERGSNE